MRILVTGSQGYIGSLLTAVLAADGHEVMGLDTGLFAEASFLPGRDSPPLIARDIRDIEAADLDGFDAVMHLAGLSNDPLGALNAKLTFEINHHATVRLAELARDAGVARFLFSSSCSVYGQGGEEPVTEESECRPQTPYAESKLLAERDLCKLARGGFVPVILRNATAFGVSPRQRFDLVVPNLCGWAHTAGQIRLQSDGTAWRPLVHIQDICGAFLALLAAPAETVSGQVFNVGRDDENYTVRTIAQTVANEFAGSRVTFESTAPTADARSYRVGFAKLRRTLRQFRPRWRLGHGVRECRACFTRVKLSAAMFEDRRYHRLRQLKHLLESGQIGPDLRPIAVRREEPLRASVEHTLPKL